MPLKKEADDLSEKERFFIFMDKHLSYFNLLDALKAEGCPLCRLAKEAVDKFLEDFLYERVNDSMVRKDLRKSSGFCPLHAWQLKRLGDSFAASIIYEDLLKALKEKITQAKNSKLKTNQNIFSQAKATDREKNPPCLACRIKNEAEERYVSLFWESFSEPEFVILYKNSFGLCARHLEMAVGRKCPAGVRDEILAVEREKIERLIEELRKIQRRNDYRFSHQKLGEEKTAWIRAVEKLAGKEGAF